MPHDDILVDSNFFTRAVETMESRPGVHAVIGNSWLGRPSDQMRMMDIPESFQGEFSGEEFVVEKLFTTLHPSYSALLYRRLSNRILSIDQLEVPIETRYRLGLEPDDAFSILITNVLSGHVWVEGAIVSVRNLSSSSWSASDFWRTQGNLGVILQFTHTRRKLRGISNTDWGEFFGRLIERSYVPSRIHWRLALFIGPDWPLQRSFWRSWIHAILGNFHGKIRRKLKRLDAIVRGWLS